MRAVYHSSYGGPEVLEVGEQPDPVVGPDSVLVRVKAAGVNPVDFKVGAGYLQGAFPSFLPTIAGWDAAGVVEAVGPAVRGFAPGDEVLGYLRKDFVRDGCYADLVAGAPRHWARKPSALSWEVAGALPLAGLTAVQSLDAVRAGAGDTVLVHAASGGVGHLAVQIAKARGARVIGTASERNHDFVRSLGAEPVVYGDGLVEAVRALAPEGVDAAVDYIGGDAIRQSAELVSDPSRTASNVDPQAVAEAGGVYCFVTPHAEQLAQLAALVADGTVRVEVQEAFALERAADAWKAQMDGHVRGKLVLTT